jgi:hypothetical protein
MSENKNDRPQIELRAGGIVGSVWTTTTTMNGRSVPQRSIRIEKRYRDDRTGEWKTTGYLRLDEPAARLSRQQALGAPDAPRD